MKTNYSIDDVRRIMGHRVLTRSQRENKNHLSEWEIGHIDLVISTLEAELVADEMVILPYQGGYWSFDIYDPDYNPGLYVEDADNFVKALFAGDTGAVACLRIAETIKTYGML